MTAGYFFCALFLSSPVIAAPKQEPATQLKFLKSMPDFCQMDRRLPGGGLQYCAPVAVSNVLVWLDQNGFPEILPDQDNSAEAQYHLIKRLGSQDYMNTDEETGTSPRETMLGLEKYAHDRGYDVAIEWRGWRDGGKFAAKKESPDLAWLKDGTTDLYNTIISVGWYTHDFQKKIFTRLGGHYVTIVGIDTRKPKEPVLYIHNPSFGLGRNPKPQKCTLSTINRGYFGPWCGYRARPAKGYFQIDGIPKRPDAQIAILDGGIKFTLLNKKLDKNPTVLTQAEFTN